MIKLVFATNNENKFSEVNKIIPKGIELLRLKDIGCFEDIPETGKTIEENAVMKARYVYEKYNLNAFSDDTGLEVMSLGAEPGVYSARYAGEERNDQKNMELVLEKLRDKQDRRAVFRTVFSLFYNGQVNNFQGIVEGEITTEKKGENGFGYDPIFKPKGYKMTFAQMPQEVKNKISHRAIATLKLISFLQSIK